MLKNQYLSFGFGDSMYNTDMVIFVSNSTNPIVMDTFSLREEAPYVKRNNYYDSIITSNDTHMMFETTRLLDTRNYDDFVIKLVRK